MMRYYKIEHGSMILQQKCGNSVILIFEHPIPNLDCNDDILIQSQLLKGAQTMVQWLLKQNESI